MTLQLFVAGVIFGAMLAEARIAARHDRDLRARGAFEPPCDPYRVMAILYPLCFVLMIAEGIWRVSIEDAAARPGAPSWFASGVLMFVAAKGLKYWAIHALGDRWSFRVMVLRGAPLVATGPYQYIAHPNYVGVIGELAGTAMMMGAMVTGPISLVLFGFVLWKRIRCEEASLGLVPPRNESRTS